MGLHSTVETMTTRLKQESTRFFSCVNLDRSHISLASILLPMKRA